MNFAALPLILSFLVPLTCVLTYSLAVYYRTVPAILPAISDCAGRPPQAAYFTELMVISTLIFMATGLLRYYQIKTILDNQEYCQYLNLSPSDQVLLHRANYVTPILGILIGLSLITLASFRVTEMPRLHTLGAITFFLCGPILYGVQTLISFRLQPHINSLFVAYVRLIVTIISAICLIMGSTFTLWSYALLPEAWKIYRIMWTEEDPGYVQHVVGMSCEWIYILIAGPFFATMIPEFNRLKLKEKATFMYILEGSLSLEFNLDLKSNSLIRLFD